MSVVIESNIEQEMTRRASEVHRVLLENTARTAHQIEVDAVSLAPFDTGDLAWSIRSVPLEDELGELGHAVIVDDHKGIWQEFGWIQRDGVFNEGQPFLRPAVIMNEGAFETTTISDVMKVVTERGRSSLKTTEFSRFRGGQVPAFEFPVPGGREAFSGFMDEMREGL